MAAEAGSPQGQRAFFQENGYLRVPRVFNPEETRELAGELDRLIQEWSFEAAWEGPWRQAILEPDMLDQVKLSALHDLQLYSAAWARAVLNPRLASALSSLLGPNVEFHHSTMHVKPPERGAPFPMHQDHPFYPHDDGRYVDVLVHLDDTSHRNGEIRFLPGSHLWGPLEHISQGPNGEPSAPHLPLDRYRLEDTVPVPARAGDVVVFSIYTVHGSYPNRSRTPRRLVRMGFRDPNNRQVAGQSLGRPGVIVRGFRSRRQGDTPFAT
jgi:phytanoyl-CoA hydroxylase